MTTATTRNGSRKPSDQLDIQPTASVLTELEAVAYNKQVTIVYLDQLPWRTTATRVVKALDLAVGQRYQSSILGRLVLEKEKQLAMDLALQLFSYRARSRREVVDKLEKRKLSTEAIDATLVKLEQAGYLNDPAFAKEWIKERTEMRGYGRRRIKNELISKGIDVEVINKELERAYTAEKERHAALQLARQRLSRYEGLDGVVVRRRLMQTMMRRGFSAQMASNVLKDIMA